MTDIEKEVLEKLKELKWRDDIENLHEEADELLIKLLTSYKKTEIVEAYKILPKWYS